MATTIFNCAEPSPLSRCALRRSAWPLVLTFLTFLTMLMTLVAGAQAAPQVLRPASGAQQTTVDIPVEALGDSRLQIQFDSTPALTAIRLQPPAAPALSWTPAQALSLPRKQRQRPALGDAYLLPVQRNPVPGVWRLTLEHAKAGTRDTVTLLARQLPRFELLLNTPGRPLPEGGVGLIDLRVLDEGVPREDVRPQLIVQPPGRAPALTLAMTPDLRNARGQRIGLDPAQFFAEYQPRQPGPHRLSVELTLTDSHQRPVPLRAGQTLQVSAAPHARDIRPSLSLQTGPAGCLQSADFDLDWQASEPGLWLMSLRLAGAASQTVEVNSHVDVKTAGAIHFKATLEPGLLKRLQAREHTEADLQLVLVAATGGSEIVFRQRGLRLPKALPAGVICN